MNTKFTLMIATVIAITTGSLQKVNAQAWRLTGNAGTNPPTNFLGTTDNKSLVFKTQGQSRMCIGQGGNLGIGIFENIGFPLNFASTTGDKISLYGNSGAHYGFGIQDNLLQIHSRASTTDIAFGYGSSAAFTERMRIKGNGYVGIGTASPIAPLHIKSTGTRVAAFDGPTNMYIEVNENGAARGYFGSAAGNDQDFELGTNSLNSTGKLHLTIKTIPKMTIDASGKVGIGTIAPGATLHVATGTDSEPGSGGFIVTGSVTGTNISIDDNEIMARNNGAGSKLHLNYDGGDVVIGGTNSGTKVGIGIASPAYQLQLSSNSAAKPGSSFWTVASDLRLKKNVTDFTDGLNVIKQIHPVWYNYNGEAGITTTERGVGTLAQELQKAAPYMVKEWAYQKEENGVKTNYLSVDYNALLFMFVNAFKEQQEEINSQDTKIEELTKLVNQLMNNQTSARASSTQTNAVTSKIITASASLEQNAPNPFNSSTVIRYHIPASVSNAQIMVTNASGNMIKTFTLNNKGAGSVTIKAGELAAGSYYYTLITDGKKVDSKQMILDK